MAERITLVFPFGSDFLLSALRTVYDYNVAFLLANPTFPRLYDLHRAGLMRFAREPRQCADTACNEERFCSIPVTYQQGWGDCDDLAPWLAAERTVRDGLLSIPIPTRSAVGWHIVVARADGLQEDPSRVCGME